MSLQSIRNILLRALLCALAAGAGPAAAEDYPTRAVTMITPFSAGSGPDVVLRTVAEKLRREWNQPVLVENRPGASGVIAMDAARKARPDGYTLLQLDSEQVAALPHLYKQRKFDTLTAFEPVAGLFQLHFMVAVPADSPWKSMKDLIDSARGGAMNYGSWSIGGPGHLGGVLLEMKSGISMQHVPFKEVSQLYASVGNNEIAWAYGSLPSSRASFQQGKIRYLAAAAPRRIAQMPDVPTVEEAGGPAGIEVGSFVTLLAPRGLPAAIGERIRAAVYQVLADSEIRTRYDTLAFEAIPWSPREILARYEARSAQYAELIQRGNVSLD